MPSPIVVCATCDQSLPTTACDPEWPAADEGEGEELSTRVATLLPIRYRCTVCPNAYEICVQCFASFANLQSCGPCFARHITIPACTASVPKSREATHLFTAEQLDGATCRQVLGSQRYGGNLRSLFFSVFALWQHRPCIGLPNPPQAIGSSSSSMHQPREMIWCRYSDVFELVRRIAWFLVRQLDLRPGNAIGICAPTSPEWLLIDLAAICCGLTVVPLDIHATEVLAFVIPALTIKALFIEADNPELIASVQRISIEMASSLAVVAISAPKDPLQLARIIPFFSLESTAPPVLPSCQTSGHSPPTSPSVRLFSLIQDVLAVAHTEEGFPPCVVDGLVHTSSILYTSGSTGAPKGAVFSEEIWLGLLRDRLPTDSTLFVSIACSSFTHISAREEAHLTLVRGGQLGFAAGDALFDSLRLVNPTQFHSVPRVWNCVYQDFIRLLKQREHEAQTVAGATLSLLERTRVRRAVYAEIRERHSMGWRLMYFTSGGAVLSDRVHRFLEECFGKAMYSQGYGCTECGVIANHHMEIFASVRWKLRDVPELGYSSTSTPRRGELLVQTKRMFSSYWRPNSQAGSSTSIENSEEASERWFATGDVVEIVRPPRTIRIIDRCSEIFKLSQGKFIAPARLEAVLQQSSLVDQICIVRPPLHAAATAIGPAAVVVPSDPTTGLHELHSDFVTLAHANRLAAHELPEHLIVTREPFTVANGQLTKSLKINRRRIQARYESDIAALCSQRSPASISGNGNDDEQDASVAKLLARHVAGKSFREQGGDSLGAVSFVSSLPNELQGRLMPQDLLTNRPLGEVLSLAVRGTLRAGDEATTLPELGEVFPTEVEFSAMSFGVRVLLSHNGKGKPGHQILMTGATGFIGAHLLAQCLHNEKAVNDHYYLLVRAASKQQGLDRLHAVFDAYALDITAFDKAVTAGRVSIVPGDLALPNLGMSQSKWSKLASRMHLVWHIGALVNHLLPYSELYPANVEGTRTILRFCADTAVKPLMHLSTLSVCPSGLPESASTSGELREFWSVHEGYVQSKFAAEYLCEQAIARGLPVIIVRPGMISWNRLTGRGNPDDWLNRLMCGLFELGFAPESSAALDLTPVDYLAGVLEIAGRAMHMVGRKINVRNPNRVAWSLLCSSHFPELVHQEYYDEYLRERVEQMPSSPHLTYLLMHDWRSMDDSRTHHTLGALVALLSGAKSSTLCMRISEEDIARWTPSQTK